MKIGDVVRMNEKFLATLDTREHANERRRKYTVTGIEKWADGTVLIGMVDGRNRETGTTLCWLE